jgi:hypothetical protein
VKVEWDENKNLQNQSKHGISFEEVQDLFLSGAEYLEVFDWEHSKYEDRFIAVGPLLQRVVVVVWTPRDEDTLRVISARPATPHETKLYEAYLERYL